MADRTTYLKPEVRLFRGEMDGDMELWLGDAFESWLPSRAALLVHTPSGEVEVRAGAILTRHPDRRTVTVAYQSLPEEEE